MKRLLALMVLAFASVFAHADGCVVPTDSSQVKTGITFSGTSFAGGWSYWWCGTFNASGQPQFGWGAAPASTFTAAFVSQLLAYAAGTNPSFVNTPKTMNPADPALAPMYADVVKAVAADPGRPAVVPTVPTVKLAGLPAATTSSGAASISYGVVPTAPVWCRLDSYAPIVCPNPFVLGATTALTPGSHRVDFYLTAAATATPSATYSWNVTAPAVVIPPPVVTPPAAVVIKPLASVNAKDPFSSMGANYLQMRGGQQNLTNVSETAGVTGNGTIVGPMGASALRFGKIKDPLDATRQVFYMAAKTSDGQTFNHLGRVEIGLDAATGAIAKTGTTYWLASELYIPSSRMSAGGNGTLVQIHNSYPPSIVTGPLELGIQKGDVFPKSSVFASYMWSSQSNPGLAGYNNNEVYPWTSDNAGFSATSATAGVAQTFGAFPTDQWVKVVMKYLGDPVGRTGLLQVWLTAGGVTTLIVNQTGIQIGTNDAPAGYPFDYLKVGLDDLTGGGTAGVWELRRSVYLFKDAGYTEPQIRALMQ